MHQIFQLPRERKHEREREREIFSFVLDLPTIQRSLPTTLEADADDWNGIVTIRFELFQRPRFFSLGGNFYVVLV